jgi:hypothetical protein
MMPAHAGAWVTPRLLDGDPELKRVLRDEGEGVRRIVGYRDRGLTANATLDVRTLEGFEFAGPSIKLAHAFLNALVRSGTWPRRPRPPLQVLVAGEQVRSRGTRRPSTSSCA